VPSGRKSKLTPVIIIAIIIGVLVNHHKITSAPAKPTTYPAVFGCTALEALWVSVGGNPVHALLAAEVAMAESSGIPVATLHDSNGSTDYGLWQVNSINGGSVASYVPPVSAREAVTISGNGTNWSPWTTYNSGAYEGKC